MSSKRRKSRGFPCAFFIRQSYGTRGCCVCFYPSGAVQSRGGVLDSRCSTFLIGPYVRHYQIDLSPYEEAVYPSFNAFLPAKSRRSVGRLRSSTGGIASPCDGKLSVYPITEGTVIPVKGCSYTIGRLLGDAELADQFRNGFCFVFRLTVDDYHRYHYFDSGRKGENVAIQGRLHGYDRWLWSRGGFSVKTAGSIRCWRASTLAGPFKWRWAP